MDFLGPTPENYRDLSSPMNPVPIEAFQSRVSFNRPIFDEADLIRERMDMANEDRLSLAREENDLDKYFQGRLYSLPASFPVLSQQTLDIPVFDADELEMIGEGFSIGALPLFDKSKVLRIKVEESDPLRLLRKQNQEMKKLNILKKRTGAENSLLNDKILNKALRDEKISDLLNQLSPKPQAKKDLPAVTHHQLTSWKPKKYKLPKNLKTRLLDLASMSNTLAIFSSEQLKSMNTTSVAIDMYTSGYFSSNLLVRPHEDPALEGMLSSLTMKLEEVADFSSLDKIPGKCVHVVSATLNNMTSVSASRSLDSCPNLGTIVDLNLGHNHLQTFEGLSDLKSLRLLNLESNKIAKISPLVSETLISLCLANNQIDQISNLEGMKHLKDIDLSGNRISAIDNLECLTLLETLDLSRNRLERVHGLQNNILLTKAVLFGNQIKTVDDWTSLFLEKLYLSENHMEDLSFMLNCPRLSELNLRANRLRSLGKASAWKIPRLASLQLSYNQLDISQIVTCCKQFHGLSSLTFSAENDLDTQSVAEKLSKHIPRLSKVNHINLHQASFDHYQIKHQIIDSHRSSFDDRLTYMLDTIIDIDHRFVGRLMPSSIYVMRRLSKIVKSMPCVKRRCIVDLLPRILRGETAFRTSALSAIKDVAKVEADVKAKIDKVRRFLIAVMRRRRERKMYFEAKIPEIITIQRHVKGWYSRRHWSHKRNPLYFHKQHLGKIIICQKLIRGKSGSNRFRYEAKVQEVLL